MSMMKIAFGAGCAVLPAFAVGVPQASRAAETHAELNKRVVAAFYDASLNRKDFAAASRYLGDHYIQHNPNAADGREGFGRYVEFLHANYPDAHSSINQVFSDGDFVILHVLQKLQPADRGNAIVDIFRLEHGRIVEHWDVKQPIPDQSANPNGMF